MASATPCLTGEGLLCESGNASLKKASHELVSQCMRVRKCELVSQDILYTVKNCSNADLHFYNSQTYNSQTHYWMTHNLQLAHSQLKARTLVIRNSQNSHMLTVWGCYIGQRVYVSCSDRQRGPPRYRTIGLWWFNTSAYSNETAIHGRVLLSLEYPVCWPWAEWN